MIPRTLIGWTEPPFRHARLRSRTGWAIRFAILLAVFGVLEAGFYVERNQRFPKPARFFTATEALRLSGGVALLVGLLLEWRDYRRHVAVCEDGITAMGH